MVVTLGLVRVMGSGVVVMMCVEEVMCDPHFIKSLQYNVCFIIACITTVCSVPLNGQIDCGSGLVNMAVEGDNCNFSCDPGYMIQENATNGTCENNGSWSGGLLSCVPLNCPDRNNEVLRLYGVIGSPSCSRQYQSQCTASCAEGFIGDNVTYLCDVTNNLTMVHWVPMDGKHVMCERGLLV